MHRGSIMWRIHAKWRKTLSPYIPNMNILDHTQSASGALTRGSGLDQILRDVNPVQFKLRLERLEQPIACCYCRSTSSLQVILSRLKKRAVIDGAARTQAHAAPIFLCLLCILTRAQTMILFSMESLHFNRRISNVSCRDQSIRIAPRSFSTFSIGIIFEQLPVRSKKSDLSPFWNGGKINKR